MNEGRNDQAPVKSSQPVKRFSSSRHLYLFAKLYELVFINLSTPSPHVSAATITSLRLSSSEQLPQTLSTRTLSQLRQPCQSPLSDLPGASSLRSFMGMSPLPRCCCCRRAFADLGAPTDSSSSRSTATRFAGLATTPSRYLPTTPKLAMLFRPSGSFARELRLGLPAQNVADQPSPLALGSVA